MSKITAELEERLAKANKLSGSSSPYNDLIRLANDMMAMIKVLEKRERKRLSKWKWIPIDDFRGTSMTAPLGWWWNTRDKQIELDEILIDKYGEVCGKGGCGADNCTYIMLAYPEDLPVPPIILTEKAGV